MYRFSVASNCFLGFRKSQLVGAYLMIDILVYKIYRLYMHLWKRWMEMDSLFAKHEVQRVGDLVKWILRNSQQLVKFHNI